VYRSSLNHESCSVTFLLQQRRTGQT